VNFEDGHGTLFEVHKTADGLKLLAFIVPADVAALNDPTRRRRDFQFYSARHKSTVPVQVAATDLRGGPALCRHRIPP
jgi:hypothetical protein